MPRTVEGLPYASGSSTSYEAAIRAHAFVAKQGLQVYAFVKARGEVGATRKEVEAALSIATQSACPRLRALVQCGAIEKTDQRRDNCAVYVAVSESPVQLRLLA